ncbi:MULTISPECIES: iron-containing alcohol dehydrogenase [Terrabacteria group]|uniref:iron-containing alcohol dehydrogenase n=1 Tax=Bacillati TaxID=1783272 RepID=UPI001C6F0AA9|nr:MULTISPECIES: iron-containing alcohol dehydrogenase [Terrabacteria group]MBW9211953.1 iron-containing alcohol dehydrogenase [Trueperella sp. zg.1013]
MNTNLIRLKQALISPIQKTQLKFLPKLYQGKNTLVRFASKLKVKKIMVVTTSGFIKRKTLEPFLMALKNCGIVYAVYDKTHPDPSLEDVKGLVEFYKQIHAEALIAIGGGSVMDCSKVALAKVSNPEISYTDVMKGKLKYHLDPLYCVPTTAGSGSEVSAGAVIIDEKMGRKRSLNHFFLIPKVVVLDPALLLSLPASLTAYSGMDALTHAIEAYMNYFNNKKTKAYALEAIALIHRYLYRSYRNGEDLEAREKMLEASYKAGIAFTNNYVGSVHALSHGIGAKYHLPHGYINAVCLPIVLEKYGAGIQTSLQEIGSAIGLKKEEVIPWISSMNEKMDIPNHLAEIQTKDIPFLAKGAEKETNPTYPVPVIWTIKDFEDVLYTIQGERK